MRSVVIYGGDFIYFEEWNLSAFRTPDNSVNNILQNHQHTSYKHTQECVFIQTCIQIHPKCKLGQWILMHDSFSDIFSDSMLQVTFIILLLVKLSYSVKEKYSQLHEMATKIFHSYPTSQLWTEASFSSQTSTQIYCKRLNAEADVRIQVSWVKSEITKTDLKCYSY